MSGGQIETRLEKPYGQTPEARAAAIERISREPQADLLLMMLGLAADPVAAAKSRAKAQAGLHGKGLK